MSEFDDLRMKGIDHLLDALVDASQSAAYRARLAAQRAVAYELGQRLRLEAQATELQRLAREHGVQLR